MDDGHLVCGLRELLDDLLVSQFQVLVVHLFALEDERVHDERLPTLGDLVADEVVHRDALVFAHAERLDGFPARRHLVDDGDVQVAVQGHGQSAGDGGRCHHQHVRCHAAGTLCPQFRPLVHAEAVLLVHDGEPQRLEIDRILDESVRAHDQADAAVLQAGVDFAPGRHTGRTGEEGGLNSRRGQVLRYVRKMLESKHFRRRHQAGLVAVRDGDEGRQHGHHRLAAAHVALQQAVHLMPAFQVLADLLDHALLGVGQIVGEGAVAAIERLAHAGHRQTDRIAAADVFLLEERGLQEEQLFEFEPVGGFRQGVLVRREVDLPQGEADRHQPFFLDDVVRKRVRQRGENGLQSC